MHAAPILKRFTKRTRQPPCHQASPKQSDVCPYHKVARRSSSIPEPTVQRQSWIRFQGQNHGFPQGSDTFCKLHGTVEKASGASLPPPCCKRHDWNEAIERPWVHVTLRTKKDPLVHNRAIARAYNTTNGMHGLASHSIGCDGIPRGTDAVLSGTTGEPIFCQPRKASDFYIDQGIEFDSGWILRTCRCD